MARTIVYRVWYVDRRSDGPDWSPGQLCRAMGSYEGEWLRVGSPHATAANPEWPLAGVGQNQSQGS